MWGDRRLKKGDEVITVAAGFPTTVTPLIQNGLVPVFVDVTLPTYNLDASQLEAARSTRTRAVMVAHTLGNPFDLDAVTSFCKKHDLWLVEDNCDASGSLYKGRKTGTFGDVSTLSFYPPHHMTMGEGGAVLCNTDEMKRAIESLRDWGRDCWCKSGVDNTCGKRFQWKLGTLPYGYDHKYVYSHLGYNLKITDMQAAVGVAQLAKLDEFGRKRRENWKFFREAFRDLEEHFILPESTEGADPSWFGFMLTVRPESRLKREAIIRHLEQGKVQTRMLFAGNLLRQPAMVELSKQAKAEGGPSPFRVISELTNTDLIMNQSFWIGVYPGLTAAQREYVVEALHAAVLGGL
jgi:CDP-6-deoxy-D-xylo-4-hexulose-3-dehydrase